MSIRARGAALWAAIACAAWGASGCGDVESCTKFDPGCYMGYPDDSGNCRFGLVSVMSGGSLVCLPKSEATSSPDAGGTVQNMCNCPSGSLCRKDRSCVDVCVPPSPLPALSVAPSPCRAPTGTTYTFEDAANAACEQACVRHAAYCGTVCDIKTECTRLKAVALATARCAGNTTPECASQFCEMTRDQPCAQVMCTNNAAPNCAGVVCNTSCTTASYVNDGVCDDGDLSNASSSVCAWGSDCGDCGPRRGTPPNMVLDLGDPCVDAYQCGGDPDHVASSTGWCVPTETQTDIQRCVPDCSAANATCPAGYQCFGLGVDPDGESGPMQQQPVTDPVTGQQAKACFPTACG
ncbi:MAG TPA: hypothetical protein VG963_15565 [Polyangiaceae bacterium]|nr:hypothetical protein [Polyangiaceae bacterium]